MAAVRSVWLFVLLGFLSLSVGCVHRAISILTFGVMGPVAEESSSPKWMLGPALAAAELARLRGCDERGDRALPSASQLTVGVPGPLHVAIDVHLLCAVERAPHSSASDDDDAVRTDAARCTGCSTHACAVHSSGIGSSSTCAAWEQCSGDASSPSGWVRGRGGAEHGAGAVAGGVAVAVGWFGGRGDRDRSRGRGRGCWV